MNLTIKNCLAQAIQQAPSADNSQPWHIFWHQNRLSLRYDTERVGDKTFPADSPATLLSIGAAVENLNQAASACNIDVDCHFSKQFDKDNPVYFQCHVVAPEKNVKISDNLHPIWQRHTNRLPYQTTKIPAIQIEALKTVTFDTLRVQVLEQQPEINRVALLVRLASEIRFQIREINEWLGKSFRFGKQVESTNDGLDVATLDLPPGGSLFLRFVSNWKRMKWLNLLGGYKLMSIIDSAPIKKAPALVAIVGKQGFRESLSAGQLMQRIWIDLNAQGIAVHPYYVICDQMNRLQDGSVPKTLERKAEQVYYEAKNIFNLDEGESLHMLFRIGYPKKKAKRSKRLPLKNICSDI